MSADSLQILGKNSHSHFLLGSGISLTALLQVVIEGIFSELMVAGKSVLSGTRDRSQSGGGNYKLGEHSCQLAKFLGNGNNITDETRTIKFYFVRLEKLNLEKLSEFQFLIFWGQRLLVFEKCQQDGDDSFHIAPFFFLQ
jgi:hypothetical protein